MSYLQIETRFPSRKSCRLAAKFFFHFAERSVTQLNPFDLSEVLPCAEDRHTLWKDVLHWHEMDGEFDATQDYKVVDAKMLFNFLAYILGGYGNYLD